MINHAELLERLAGCTLDLTVETDMPDEEFERERTVADIGGDPQVVTAATEWDGLIEVRIEVDQETIATLLKMSRAEVTEAVLVSHLQDFMRLLTMLAPEAWERAAQGKAPAPSAQLNGSCLAIRLHAAHISDAIDRSLRE